ncbi:hypothetical protein [Nocardioides jiangxiensis]|uniref:Uncharacterized protein n=1 Tax=Nocardioides jiangxiensis TaxID=3064524 RepID=A0ABT9B4F6_9ACTN|nr:hypothetical protein [Nocardioides sp. WY-20]MDO7869602.1 hypothetical protein [Nocardioides sp. WY-20]
MPRHTRTFLLVSLGLVLIEALLVVQEAIGEGSNHLMLYVVLPLAFFATGVATIVYAERQEEPKERDIARGSSVVPFGCFVASVAIALWVAMLAYVHQ